MKIMTCRELGGACDLAFRADTFEEMAQQSKQHGLDMYDQGDVAHLAKMDEIAELMKSPEAMKAWFAEKRKAFDARPDVD